MTFKNVLQVLTRSSIVFQRSNLIICIFAIPTKYSLSISFHTLHTKIISNNNNNIRFLLFLMIRIKKRKKYFISIPILLECYLSFKKEMIRC